MRKNIHRKVLRIMKAINQPAGPQTTSAASMKYKGITTKNLVITAMMAAVTCVLGPLSLPLPFTPVPVSLTNFVIYLAAFVLTWKYCTLSYIVYVLLGAIGLPVFSGFGSGIDKIAGPTGGYLLGFVFTALICSIVNKKFAGKLYMYVAGMAAGLFVAYAFGTLWFMYQQGMGLKQSLALCVVPFLIGDAVKIAVASIVGPALRKAVNAIQ